VSVPAQPDEATCPMGKMNDILTLGDHFDCVDPGQLESPVREEGFGLMELAVFFITSRIPHRFCRSL
jgi:hypothetical protein